LRLRDKVCLVAGGLHGIGPAIAEAMAAEGARVATPDIDVGAEADWRRAIAEIEAGLGPLSILVTLSGAACAGPIAGGDLACWRGAVDAGLTGVFLGMQAAAPSLCKAGGGVIINVIAETADPGGTAGQWGVRGLTRTAALELGRHGVRANTLRVRQAEVQAAAAARMAVFIAAEATYSTASDFVCDVAANDTKAGKEHHGTARR
jgi:3alpha(or 20beta)-hydroxysteroid dehydrogenase